MTNNTTLSYFRLLLFINILILLIFGAYSRNITWKDEVTIWEDIVSKSPNKARGYSNLAHFGYLKKDLVDEAITCLIIAIRIEPAYAEARANLGIAYLRKGRRDDAIHEFETALRYNFNLPVIHSKLAFEYAMKGQKENAIRHFRYAAKIDVSAVNYYDYALSLQQANRLSEAVTYYKKALELNPKYFDAALNMANAFDILGQNETALQYYIYSLELNPRSGDAFYNLGLYYERLKQFAAAENAYQKAIALEPGLAEKYPRLRKFSR